MAAWSYSSITTFEKCPKKYYHLKVARDYEDKGGEAADYGSAVHEAAELYVTRGEPIPGKFAFIKPLVEHFANLPGDKYAELKLGVTEDFRPCDFFADDVWWRGIADLLIVDGPLAYCIDYKTGKSARYADIRQLDLLAGAVFLHFPQVMKVKSALAFVVAGDLITKDHIVTKRDKYLTVFDRELKRLEAAHEDDVWNANPTGLCGWCPVKGCAHWKDRR